MSPEIKQMVAMASSGVQTTSIYSLASDFISYSHANRSKGTMPARICRMKNFTGFLLEAGINDISQLNTAVIDIYFDKALEEVTPSTKNATRAVVKAFINWIEDVKGVETPVRTSSIKLTKEGRTNPKYIDFEQITQVINSHDVQYVDRLLVAVASMMGLRASEIADMKFSDIRGDQLSVCGKGDNERSVTIPNTVKGMIDIYIQLAPYYIKDDSYLFQSYWRGEWNQMTAKTIWRRIKEVFKRTCNIDVWPHKLRHSYAVYLLLNGCDIITIQKSLGHTDVKITQGYLNIADTVVSNQIHKFFD